MRILVGLRTAFPISSGGGHLIAIIELGKSNLTAPNFTDCFVYLMQDFYFSPFVVAKRTMNMEHRATCPDNTSSSGCAT